MGEIVNLRTRRRRRDRADEAAHAAENRARHGRTGAEKDSDRLHRANLDHVLDQARLDDAPTDMP